MKIHEILFVPKHMGIGTMCHEAGTMGLSPCAPPAILLSHTATSDWEEGPCAYPIRVSSGWATHNGDFLVKGQS